MESWDGDFHTVRFCSEKLGGRCLTEANLRDLNNCMLNCGLTDLKSSGGCFTWSNHSPGSCRIVGKLDRAICNQEWMNSFPQSFAEILNPSSSDHSPILVRWKAAVDFGPRPFRHFYNWVSKPSYFEVVKPFKEVKKALKSWSKEESKSSNYIQRCRAIQNSLKSDPMNPFLSKEEVLVQRRLHAMLEKEESKLQQLSRIQWLHSGDRNTRFFFSSLKSRIAANTILAAGSSYLMGLLKKNARL